jgi:phage gpG-like protein
MGAAGPSDCRGSRKQGIFADEPLLRTGELRESIEKHVERHEAVVGSDSKVAVAQELGTTTIPPRSFLGAAGLASVPVLKAEFAGAIVTAMHHAKRGGI